jgi:hypothetical protein
MTQATDSRGATGAGFAWLTTKMVWFSARSCVVPHARKVEYDAGLLSDGPAVVSGRDRDHVAGTDLELGAVVHMDHLAAREHVSEVSGLAAVGPGNRSYMLRPTPTGFERNPTNHPAADVHELDLALVLKLAGLIWFIEALAL